MRTILGKLALLFISLLATFAVAEFAVRMLGWAPKAGQSGGELQSMLEFDPLLETSYRPGAEVSIRSQYGEFSIQYAINELGLRDRPVPPRDQDPAFRVLAVGNSFVEGWGVSADQCFVRIAEEAANERKPADNRRVRLINAGISGYGGAQCLLQAKRLVPIVKPDAVVFFYVPTMASADAKFLKSARLDESKLATGVDVDAFLKPATPTVSGSWFVDSPTVSAIAEYSHLVRFLRTRMANRAALNNIVVGDPSSDLLAAYRCSPEKTVEVIEPTLRHVSALAGYCESQQIPFRIIAIPMPFEVSPIEWKGGRQIYLWANEETRHESLWKHSLEAFEQHATPTFKAHDFVRKHAAQKAGDSPVYYSFDFHQNVEGQRLLGQWLCETLQETWKR